MATVTPGWHYLKRRRNLRGVSEYFWTAPIAAITIPGVADGAGGGTRYVGLEAIIQAAGGVAANIEVAAPNSEMTWRMAARDHTHQYASRLAATSGIVRVPYDGVIFDHDTGLSMPNMAAVLAESKAYVESLTGVSCVSHVYPLHHHDRQTMRMLREMGYIVARDGWVSPYFPEGATLGDVYTTVAEAQSWALWTPYEMLGHLYFTSTATPAGVGGLSKAQMEAYLYFTSANQTTPATTLYGYDDLMAMWKANNTWVQFNIHYNITAAEAQALMEIFNDDGDFWVDSLGTIAAYAHARHAPFGPVRNDEFVYEPLAGHSAADYGGAPWNGKKCAITFTCDDGEDGLTDYVTAAGTVGIVMTAGIIKDLVGVAGYMDAAGLTAMHAGGSVELACHGPNSPKSTELNISGCSLSYPGSETVGVEISVSGNNRIMQVYTGETGNWYDPIVALTGIGGVVDADTLTIGSLSGGTWSPIVGTLTGTGVRAGDANYGKIMVEAGPNGHQCVRAYTDDGLGSESAVNWGGVDFTDITTWDAGNGMTVFVLAKSDSTASGRALFGKWVGSGAGREWAITSSQGNLSSDGTTWASTANSGFTSTAAWHALIMTWVPGSAQRVYVDSVASAYATGTAAVAGLTDQASVVKMFHRNTGGASMKGRIAVAGWLPRGIAHGGADLATIMAALKAYGGL